MKLGKQLRYHYYHPDTLRREVDGLTNAMKEIKALKGMILMTDGKEDTLRIGKLTIEIKQAWRWLLDEGK